MARKRIDWPTGKVVTLEHRSQVLRKNPLGDPHVRPLTSGCRQDTTRPPDRASASRCSLTWWAIPAPACPTPTGRNFSENVPERAARLIHEGKMGPCILVFPDCFTALGGNQYINSSAMGRYADYLTGELIPFVDKKFSTLASREHRGCFGKSSGGYGAMVHGMKYARYWGAIANHSGDAYFDFLYRCEWPNGPERTWQVSGRRSARRAPSTCSKEEQAGDRRAGRRPDGEPFWRRSGARRNSPAPKSTP